MNDVMVDKIVSAVLYEGYMLYPYRPSVKNHQRWTFGGVLPREYSETHGGADPWAIQTQCLVQGDRNTRLDIKVRFLHLMARQIGQLDSPIRDLQPGEEPVYRPVPSLQIGQTLHQTWQEAVERELVTDDLRIHDLAAWAYQQPFHFPAARTVEPLHAADGGVIGLAVRQQQRLEGTIEIDAQPLGNDLFRVTLRVLNQSRLSGDAAKQAPRDEALMQALASTHAVLGVRQGRFISLMDPPDSMRDAAADCRNLGLWPVLVGEEGQTDTMLAAPIILYDYPQVAPESPGDLFDSTEIDELLTLRIMTLTDEEKQTMAAVDSQTRALLERTEAMARDELAGLHGALRNLRPAKEP